MIFINIIKWSLYFLNSFIFVFLFPLACDLLKCSLKTKWKYAKLFSKISLRIFSIKVKIHNPNKINLNDQFILAPNHRSWFDQLILIHIFEQPLHIFSKSEYFDIPFFGKGMKSYEFVPVKNKSIELEQFEEIMSYIDRKESLLIFLEGTRNLNIEMLPFAPGAFKLSVKKNIPLLPIHIIGSDQILSKANSLLSIKPGVVEIHLMPPVTLTKNNYKNDIDSFEKVFRTQNKEMLQAFINNDHSKG